MHWIIYWYTRKENKFFIELNDVDLHKNPGAYIRFMDVLRMSLRFAKNGEIMLDHPHIQVVADAKNPQKLSFILDIPDAQEIGLNLYKIYSAQIRAFEHSL